MERILIIDDDVALCEMLTERLQQDEFVIETVNDGIRGLERARSGEHALIVLDRMPTARDRDTQPRLHY